MPTERKISAFTPVSESDLKERTTISDDFYSFFSNRVRVAASQTEFRIFFGEIYPTASDELKVVEQICVVLTPTQVKATTQLLSRLIEQIESKFGPIPVPETVSISDQAPSPPESPPKP